MQIIKYEVNKNILTVGFKVDNFVVYSSVVYDKSKTKNQLLQLAYEKVKKTIDYEKTLTEHSFITDEVGIPFTPTLPVVKSIKLSVNKDNIKFSNGEEIKTVNITVDVKDQYGDSILVSTDVTSNYGTVKENVLTIPKVSVPTEVTITASNGAIYDTKKIYVEPYIKIKEDNPLLNALDRVNKLEAENAGLVNSLNNLITENAMLLNNVYQLSDVVIRQDVAVSDLEIAMAQILGGGI